MPARIGKSNVIIAMRAADPKKGKVSMASFGSNKHAERFKNFAATKASDNQGRLSMKEIGIRNHVSVAANIRQFKPNTLQR